MSMTMTCDQILWELNYCDGTFPEAAVQAARQHRDEIIPRLITAISDATKIYEDRGAVETWGHIAALFLLYEFNAKQAFPAIMESACSSGSEGLYGDFIAEDLHFIAARLASGPDQMLPAIADPSVNPDVRAAFMEAVFVMVCEQRISREQAILFLRQRLREGTDNEDFVLVTKSVEMLGLLWAEEAQSEVRAAEREELIEDEWIGPNFFQQQLQKGQPGFEEAKSRYLDGLARISIDSLSTMPFFREKRPITLTLEDTLAKIRQPFTTFPEDAVRWARQHREEIIPHLIQIIQDIPKYVKSRDRDPRAPESFGHVIALYLLTEFGNREILPTLLSLLSDADENGMECFHEVIELDMAQILGRLADKPDQLKMFLTDRHVIDSVRGDAAESIVWMVTEGKLDRSEAIELLLDWLQESREAADSFLTSSISLSLMYLGASVARETLLNAFEAGEMDEEWPIPESIHEALDDGDQTFLESIEYHRQDRIEHTGFELRAWSRGDSEFDFEDFYIDSYFRDNGDLSEPGMSPVDVDREEYTEPSRVTSTIRMDGPRIGRNDACPCGSGKKFKKCCAKADKR